MPSRRQVLGAVAVGFGAALAGCLHPSGAIRMREATTDEIVDNTTDRVDGEDEERDLLEELLAEGSATAEATRPPLRADRLVAYENRVYDLSVAERGERTRTDYVIELDFDPADAEGTEIAFEDLSSVDRERVAPLLEREPPGENDGVDIGTRAEYADDERESSVLVPEQEVDVLLVDDDPVRVRTEPTDTTVTSYEYAIEDQLGAFETFADDVRETYRFALTDLSADEREVVEEAIDVGSYYASSSDDDAFEGVARAFLEHQPVTSDEDGAGWLCTYAETTYWARLEFLDYRELRKAVPRDGTV